MKEENYQKNKQKVLDYLEMKKCFCFKKTISKDLIFLGMKKTTISKTLQEMRKRKEIKKAFRRWGL